MNARPGTYALLLTVQTPGRVCVGRLGEMVEALGARIEQEAEVVADAEVQGVSLGVDVVQVVVTHAGDSGTQEKVEVLAAGCQVEVEVEGDGAG